MKILVLAAISLFSVAGQAATLCDAYADRPRFFTALKAVAAHQELTMDEFCQLPNVLGIEAQPSRVVTREGNVIPHVRVELHYSYHSCSFMVRDADLEITGGRCYSTF